MGVFYATVQTDIYRLLAHSSAEKLGIVFVALALVYLSTHGTLLGMRVFVAAV